MTSSLLTQALKEAYASAPSHVVILDTLELRHPAFRNEAEPKALRLVRNYQDLVARLEDNAPLEGGCYVTFTALAFDLTLPPLESVPVPEIVVHIDNVSRYLMPYLDQASISPFPIEMTYRPYLSTHLEAPQMTPPLTLTLSEVVATAFSITARARMLDVGSLPFPSLTYTPKAFPGLVR